MIKRVAQILIALAIGSSSLAGGDVWEEKEFTQWSEKDVRKILTSSPWALPVRVNRPYPASGAFEGGNEPGPPQSGGALGDDSSRPSSDGAGPGGEFEGAIRREQAPPSLEVNVSWATALPIKQAMARRRFGNEVGTNAQAKEFIERKEDHYVAAVVGLNVPMIQQAQNPLMSELRCGKEKVRPAKIEVQEQGPSGVVYLFFPRTREITLEDKQIELVMNLGEAKLNRKFKLKDMVFKGKLEI
ncbi:MAG: hypothetical protein FJW26_12160 [Acidimicrobiia bacterium]|nr:hypothetical protein [Acidimicrobiia bacterium]